MRRRGSSCAPSTDCRGKAIFCQGTMRPFARYWISRIGQREQSIERTTCRSVSPGLQRLCMRICACEQVVRSILRPMRLRFWHPKTSSVEMPLSLRWDIPRVLWKAVSAIRSGGSCSAPRPGLGTTVTERYPTLCPLQGYPPLRVRNHPLVSGALPICSRMFGSASPFPQSITAIVLWSLELNPWIVRHRAHMMYMEG